MDAHRSRFLFDTDSPPIDLDDDDELAAYFESHLPPVLGEGRLHGALRSIVARQIMGGDPPITWLTAQRLLDLGHSRERVLGEISIVLLGEIQDLLEGPDGEAAPRFDEGRFADRLAALPLPSADEVSSAVESAIAVRQGISTDSLVEAVLAELGRAGDVATRSLVLMMVDDRLVRGPMRELGQGRLVHAPSLARAITLTHRLTSQDIAGDRLSCVADDLAGFAWLVHPRSSHGELIVDWAEAITWVGPPGWLTEFAAGDVIAVSVGAEDVVSLRRVADHDHLHDDLHDHLHDPGVLDVVRRAWQAWAERDDEIDDDDGVVPILLEDLVYEMLLVDPTVFDVPRAPLVELCASAGLQVRGGLAAVGEEPWRRRSRDARADRVHEAADGSCDLADPAIEMLETLEDPDSSPEVLRAVLRRLRDGDILRLVLDELLDEDLEHGDVDSARTIAEALVDAARRPSEQAVAHFIAGMVEERAGSLLAADAHFHLGVVAESSLSPIADRAAWYASLRGDAATALRLWRTVESVDPDEVEVVARIARSAKPSIGRNEPCWCGSGRKFKACHQSMPASVSLPDRVAWLCRKATGYLVRRQGAAFDDVMDLALARAVDQDDVDSIRDALADPIVIDGALTEGGWFEQFLSDAGPLLPDDEALLASSWLLVDRTVYEVEDVMPGSSVSLRDVATGERLTVRERTFSRQARPGTTWCGRAVPDGESHQLIGAVLPVGVGREAEVLDLCARDDGHALCDYARSLHAPPTIRTREDEDIVTSTAIVQVDDAEEAADVLDRLFDEDDGGWVELHEIGPDEQVLRARLEPNGDELVIVTHSEPRMDRILELLRRELPSAELISDERIPLRPAQMPTFRRHGDDRDRAELDPAVQEAVVAMMEQRWLSDHVPALGGLSPVEAAADPTRRGDLIRLLDSFSRGDPQGPMLMMDPERLKAALGL